MSRHQQYIGTYKNGKALIIGNGPSAKRLVPKKIRNKYDVIIGVNYAHKYYDHVMDFHICLEEKAIGIIKDLNHGTYNRQMPRLFNEDAIDQIDHRYNILFTPRRLDAAIYNYTTGLLWALPPYKEATVTFQALHWAILLGCTDIRFIGCEHRWAKEEDRHFYTDQVERTSEQYKYMVDDRLMAYTCEIGEYRTLPGYIDSAKCIDKLIEIIKPEGIKVYDYSDGLISKAERI